VRGFGGPKARDPALVREDVLDGKIPSQLAPLNRSQGIVDLHRTIIVTLPGGKIADIRRNRLGSEPVRTKGWTRTWILMHCDVC